MLRALAVPISFVLLAYAFLRTVDVVNRGQFDAITRLDGFSFLFLLEMALFVVPAVALLLRRAKAQAGFFTAMAVMVVLAGGLYRFSTFLFAFRPGPAWSYHPSLTEVAVTVGFVALEVLGYIVLVKRFPVLRGLDSDARDHAVPPEDKPDRPVGEPVLVGVGGVDFPWSRPSEEELHALVDA